MCVANMELELPLHLHSVKDNNNLRQGINSDKAQCKYWVSRNFDPDKKAVLLNNIL